MDIGIFRIHLSLSRKGVFSKDLSCLMGYIYLKLYININGYHYMAERISSRFSPAAGQKNSQFNWIKT